MKLMPVVSSLLAVMLFGAAYAGDLNVSIGQLKKQHQQELLAARKRAQDALAAKKAQAKQRQAADRKSLQDKKAQAAAQKNAQKQLKKAMPTKRAMPKVKAAPKARVQPRKPAAQPRRRLGQGGKGVLSPQARARLQARKQARGGKKLSPAKQKALAARAAAGKKGGKVVAPLALTPLSQIQSKEQVLAEYQKAQQQLIALKERLKQLRNFDIYDFGLDAADFDKLDKAFQY